MERESFEAGVADGDTRQPPRRNVLIQIVLGLVVLAIGAMVAWSMFASTADVGRRAPPERSARLVEVHEARLGTHTVSVTAWGEVMPSRRLAVRPRVAGRVAKLGSGFEPGNVVREGELLVQLDKQDYNLAVQRAESALTQARADLALEQGQQAVAHREYELLGEEVAEAERGLVLRKPQLDTARAAVRSAEADLADARLALERTRLTAPFDALVLSRDVSTGSEVTNSTTVAELVGVETWWVELSVPVTALQWIRFPGPDGAGSTVRLHHEGVWSGGAHRQGRVLRLRGDLAESGRLARVLVAVDEPLGGTAGGNDKPRLLLGAFMKGEIQGRSLENSVALEPEWLRSEDTVWVMDEQDQLAMREVNVAYRDQQRILVTDGIEAGDRIVTSQLAAPTEGMPLRVQAVETRGETGNGG